MREVGGISVKHSYLHGHGAGSVFLSDLGCNIMALHLSTAATGVKTGGSLELFKA